MSDNACGWEAEKYACLTLLPSDAPKTMFFVAHLTNLTLFLGKKQNVYFSKSVSAVSDIPQKPLSWARLTEAVSDMHIFPVPSQKHGNHAECVCCGKILADATNQMKADLPLPLLQREG